jgi:hypothetical protein
MEETPIFEDRYRVVAVEEQSLTLRAERTGDVLKIVNADPQNPFTEQDYPPGKLIALNDPSVEPGN